MLGKHSIFLFIAGVLILLVSGGSHSQPSAVSEDTVAELEKDVTQGALRVEQEDGTIIECPLKHTDVKASISGFIARVVVTQTFHNPYDDKIEAVYVFPLPHKSAVDDMTMQIGDRRIVGMIKRRAEARQIYEEALSQGKTASLLEQERPNIFTQSVGNIAPGQEIQIEISYLDVLEYDMGTYEFHFPMVVGPRYNAGAAFPGTTGGPNSDPKTIVGNGPTTKPHGVNPSVLKPGYRTGHDISLQVKLDCGVPLQDLEIPTHQVETQKVRGREVVVTLSPNDAIPNKDFVMKYNVIGEKPEMAVLGYKTLSEDGYFMLMIQPRLDEELKKAPPRELVFLIDVSGSMSGDPTNKVKQTMEQMFKRCRPDDRLQVITFAGQANKLFASSVPVTEENTEKALNFTQAIRAGGGTRMLEGIKMVLNEPPDPERVRICIMLTDGYIGNEAEIISEVGKRAGDKIRFWTLGIGSSPNRFLIDGVAKQGGGMAKIVGLQDDPEPLVEEIMERIHRAQLAGISIDWGGFDVYETYPTRIPELWAGRPVVVFGRYSDGGRHTIEIKGDVEGTPITYPLRVRLPRQSVDHEVLMKVWARRKIEQLMDETYSADVPEVVEEITQIALEYRLMSQFTSFVAVDEASADSLGEVAKPPRRVAVPVPLPEGVQFEGIFGPVVGDEVDYVEYSMDLFSSMPQKGKKVFHDKNTMLGRMPTRRAAGGANYFAQTASRGTIVRPVASAMPGMQMPSFGPAVAGKKMVDGFGGNHLLSLGYLGRAARQPASVAASKSPNWFAREEAEALVEVDGDLAVVSQQERQKNVEQAVSELKTAEELRKDSKPRQAYSHYQLVYLLDMASGQRTGTASQAVSAMGELKNEQIEKDLKQFPKLKDKVNLIIRDCTLQDAIAQVGRAGKVDLKLAQGALEDVEQLMDASPLRVDYLDLRGVNVATALEWLLDPYHLIWRVKSDQEIMITTTRRLPGQWPWVYDVTPLVYPLKSELQKDKEKNREIFENAFSDFLEVVDNLTGFAKGDEEIQWLGKGHLLVFGNSGAHAKVSAWLDLVRKGASDPAKICPDCSEQVLKRLRSVHAKAVDRYKERKEALAKIREKRQLAEAYQKLQQYSWNLLSSAMKGQVDQEALTLLQTAWREPKIEELFKKESALPAFRALWALSEAARALPDNKDIQSLSQSAIKRCGPKLADASAQLLAQPDDMNQYLPVLYGTLAVRDQLKVASVPDSTFLQAVALLKRERSGLPLRDLRLCSMILLESEPNPALAEALSGRLDEGSRGEDLTVLIALAARKSGGKVWQQYRQQSVDILSRQQLPGSVVVLVHNLAGHPLPVTVAKK